jgi:alanine racemase
MGSPVAEGVHRPAWAEIDLGAIEHNASVLASVVAPSRLCAVVKADAYGHGAVAVARAALAGGASELAVAIVDEGVELRDAGIDAPILLLAEPAPDAMPEAFRWRLTPTLYTHEGIAAAALAARAVAGSGVSDVARASAVAPPSGTGGVPVEVKVDTGMHRVGADPAALVALARCIADAPELELAGLWTHFAVADEPENGFTALQLRRFDEARQSLRAAGVPDPWRVHAANSAGAVAWPDSRLDMVRCGICLYGYPPSPALAPAVAAATLTAGWAPGDGLRPALSWIARVSLVRELAAGERVSYGLLQPLSARSFVATVPLGYGDGIPRAYFTGGGEVLLNGRRRRLAGSVTMDQILVDCGDDASVAPGDEVVLIGEQGGEQITAEHWAASLDTICYEVVTRIGSRVRRTYRPSSSRPNAGTDHGQAAGAQA